MATLQIFDKLLQFPLFQGMSRDDLELVAGHTRFGFVKVPQGKAIVKEGAACTHLYFLINGTIRVESRSDDRSYTVIEQMQAPFILQPESIFGYQQFGVPFESPEYLCHSDPETLPSALASLSAVTP